MSTQDKTHVFTLDDVEGLSPLADSSSFATTRRTLAALNMKKRKGAEYLDSGLVVQVTDAEVIVLDYDETLGTHAIVDRWTPGQDGGVQGSQIVGASMSPSQVALALTGGILLLCNLDDKRNDKFFVARYASHVLHFPSYTIDPNVPSQSQARILGFRHQCYLLHSVRSFEELHDLHCRSILGHECS